MKIPPLAPEREYQEVGPAIVERIERVVKSGRFILADEVRAFEKDFASWVGSLYSLGVANGTDALILALKAAGLKKGDEVITAPYTYFATVESIVTVGATPVFADIDPETFNIDPRKIEARITPKTRAILPVHLYGQCAAMNEIMKIAKARGLIVIEDAAQAHGASLEGTRAGNFGFAGCFSFYPTKNLGTYGDGGSLTVNDPKTLEQLKSLRAHGASPTDRYFHEDFGMNSRLDEIQAAILNVKLKRLDSWIAKRQKIAGVYTREFSKLSWLKPPVVKNGTHVFHQYTLRTAHRDALEKHLNEKGVSAAVYYRYPMHLLPPVKALGFKEGDYPEAEKASREVLSLPCFPQMTDEEIGFVVDTVKSFKA